MDGIMSVVERLGRAVDELEQKNAQLVQENQQLRTALVESREFPQPDAEVVDADPAPNRATRRRNGRAKPVEAAL